MKLAVNTIYKLYINEYLYIEVYYEGNNITLESYGNMSEKLVGLNDCGSLMLLICQGL